MKLRSIILGGTLVLVLGLINWKAFQHEQLARDGVVVFLQLAPVDPRSLMQGDYMQLRYAISDSIPENIIERRGTLVIRLDQRRIAQFDRIYRPDMQLAANEHLLQYHTNGSHVLIGPEAFFFQEGQAQAYEQARYAELRLSETGEIALISLRGDQLELLGK